MKRILKYILPCACGCILAACMIIAFTSGSNARKSILCQGIEVIVKDSLENGFVTRTDVKSYIDKEYGSYIGVPIDSINLSRIEDIVDGRSAVNKSQAYVTKDGKLHVDVTQRKPVVRFQKKDGGFYADAEGYIFPLQSTYASHVQIIDGDIPLAANSGYKGDITDPKEKEWFKSVMNVVNYMEDSRLWKGKIVQISVDSKGNLTLIPREGNERFLFGQPHSLVEKFGKMERYYTTIVPEKGSSRYKRVDVRFKDQIVCR